MMKELLRVTLGARQVREACAAFAAAHLANNGEMAAEIEGIADEVQVSVIFRKKRERQPRTKP